MISDLLIHVLFGSFQGFVNSGYGINGMAHVSTRFSESVSPAPLPDQLKPFCSFDPFLVNHCIVTVPSFLNVSFSKFRNHITYLLYTGSFGARSWVACDFNFYQHVHLLTSQCASFQFWSISFSYVFRIKFLSIQCKFSCIYKQEFWIFKIICVVLDIVRLCTFWVVSLALHFYNFKKRWKKFGWNWC